MGNTKTGKYHKNKLNCNAVLVIERNLLRRFVARVISRPVHLHFPPSGHVWKNSAQRCVRWTTNSHLLRDLVHRRRTVERERLGSRDQQRSTAAPQIATPSVGRTIPMLEAVVLSVDECHASRLQHHSVLGHQSYP